MTKTLVAVLRGETRPIPPIWLMRQAGRYLPEYRALRARATGFLDFCLTPDLAVEATLQPVRRFGLDAAILFSDILTVPFALGQPVAFVEGEGPKLDPIRSPAGLTSLDPTAIAERLAPVYRAVEGVRAALSAETALIGFAGAPWTIAAYMVEGEGSRDFASARTWSLADPAGFGRLIDLVVEATTDHLIRQIDAGTDAVQLFDSWAGVLSEAGFRQWVIEPTRRIVTGVKARHPEIPIIGFPRGAGALLPLYAATGVDAVGVDTGTPLGWARSVLQPVRVVQGNLDPVALLVGGPALDAGIQVVLNEAQNGPLVFNLGHGVLPGTPPEHVAEVVRQVRSR